MSRDRPRDASARASGDQGQVGGIEVLPFSLLIFVIGSLAILNAWAVIDAKLAVDSAASEAIRALVESPDLATGSRSAESAAHAALSGHGRDDQATITIETPAGFRRCAQATVVVSVDVPRLRLPLLGGHGGQFEVTAHHTELIDPYRSGLEGPSLC